MSKKLSIVIVAIILIVVINNLHVFGRNGLGGFIDFLLSFFIVYRAYILYKKIDKAWPALPKKQVFQLAIKAPAVTAGSTAHQLGVVALIFGLIFISAGYQVVGAGGFNFFVWGDHILGNGSRPVISWSLVGLLAGAMTGSLVIWRKYNIKFQWCLATIIPFLLILIVLEGLSGPLQSISPRPLVVTADASSTAIDSTYIKVPEKKQHRVVKPVVQVAAAREPVADDKCAGQMADVSVNTRTDSVNIYYRTSGYRDGPWGPWRAKFIPLQGEFALTEGGQVRANSLQYYYEIKSVLTRSAQNPYTRILCEGQLVIDTY
jgi:hypothetical protein